MNYQRLSAGHGWQWLKLGYALFMKAPLLWVVLLMICFIAAAGLSAVPVVGEPLASLLMPVVIAGLMSGCRALEQDDELELPHLLNGFRQHTAQLVTLGGISLVSQLLIFGVMMLIGGATLVSLLMSGQPPEDPRILAQAIAGAGFSAMVGLALFAILMMAMQFAPMLVYFDGVAPVEALKLSLRGFLANFAPMLVYGATLLLLGLLASMPMMLGWLILLPVVMASMYASYRQIFVPDASSAENAAPENTTEGN